MYAVNLGITVSVDSLSQLETFGQHNPGGNVAVRINPGFGIGHHENVVTGEKTKFGINDDCIEEIKSILKYKLNLVGINQHIGSLFMEGSLTYRVYAPCLILQANSRVCVYRYGRRVWNTL